MFAWLRYRRAASDGPFPARPGGLIHEYYSERKVHPEVQRRDSTDEKIMGARVAAPALPARLRRMELNDTVIFDGRRYVVVGVDPMSVRPQRVYLRDLNGGEEVTRLYDDLMERALEASNRALRGDPPADD